MLTSIAYKVGSVAGMGMLVGSPFLLLMMNGYDPTVKSGDGKANELKLVAGKENTANLGFNVADIISGGGIKVGEKTQFKKELKLRIGNHEIKEGDLLCSLDQNGKYFLMKSNGRSGFKVDGFKGNPQFCNKRQFGQKRNKWPTPNIEIEEFKRRGVYGPNSSPATIYLPSCYFTLNNETQENQARKQWSMSLSGCRPNKWNHGYHGTLPDFKLVMSYQLN